MMAWLSKWLPIVFGCHCLDRRSFHYRGRRFPLCARCTGELFGILLCLASFPFVRVGVLPSALALLPLVVDGGIQALTPYESGNGRRLVTGLLFGYGLASLFLLSTLAVVGYGMALGEKLRS